MQTGCYIIYICCDHLPTNNQQNDIMLKKIYKTPTSDALLLHVEGTLCASVDITDNNDIIINDITETNVTLDWTF